MAVFSQAERELIDAARVGRLSTVDSEGRPHLVPICFVLVDGCFYSLIDNKPKASKQGLKRLRNIAANPSVAFLIDHYEEDWRHLAYLLVHGSASVVTEPDQYSRALEALRFKYSQYRGQSFELVRDPMIRVDVARSHYWAAKPGLVS